MMGIIIDDVGRVLFLCKKSIRMDNEDIRARFTRKLFASCYLLVHFCSFKKHVMQKTLSMVFSIFVAEYT